MGHKPLKKAHYNIFVKTEEEIEDMKRIYYIQGKPILALNEKIANEIYMRNYKEPKKECKEGMIMKIKKLLKHII